MLALPREEYDWFDVHGHYLVMHTSHPCQMYSLGSPTLPEEVIQMDIESRLRNLELRYRLALSATVAAKALYLALAGEPGATAAAVERANGRWKQLDARKRALAARMGEVEAFDEA
jgi:hypothetical protein